MPQRAVCRTLFRIRSRSEKKKKKKTEKTRNFFSMEEEVTDTSFCQHVSKLVAKQKGS